MIFTCDICGQQQEGTDLHFPSGWVIFSDGIMSRPTAWGGAEFLDYSTICGSCWMPADVVLSYEIAKEDRK